MTPLTGCTTTPVAVWNCAAAPTPSTAPATPLPATRLTTPPSVVTLRSLLPLFSPKYSSCAAALALPPPPAAAMDCGTVNPAEVPTPFALPGAPLPATASVAPLPSATRRTKLSLAGVPVVTYSHPPASATP
jgi:hypothetical protein